MNRLSEAFCQIYIFFSADGACRHVAAALYELEAFEKKSCKEGDNEWVKRPRHHDIPVPIRQLTVAKVKYVTKPGDGAMKPHIDVFDPRLENHRQPVTDGDKKEFGLRLQMVCTCPLFFTSACDSDTDVTELYNSVTEYRNELKFLDSQPYVRSADPDWTAPRRAV